MTGAFLLIGGAVFAAIFNIAALRRERPSEIVVLFRLVRIAVGSISLGMLLTLVFGLWLVADLEFVKWGDAWVILALVLWVVANALGGMRRTPRKDNAPSLPSASLRKEMRQVRTCVRACEIRSRSL